MRINVIVPLNKKTFHRRLDELEHATIEEICGFLTGDEINKYLRISLKNVTVKVIRRPKNQIKEFPISVQIYSETPGFPMICKCADIKCGLLKSIRKLADLTPDQECTVIMGIVPMIAEKSGEKPKS